MYTSKRVYIFIFLDVCTCTHITHYYIYILYQLSALLLYIKYTISIKLFGRNFPFVLFARKSHFGITRDEREREREIKTKKELRPCVRRWSIKLPG